MITYKYSNVYRTINDYRAIINALNLGKPTNYMFLEILNINILKYQYSWCNVSRKEQVACLQFSTIMQLLTLSTPQWIATVAEFPAILDSQRFYRGAWWD